MNVKTCTALVALALAVPAVSMAVSDDILDQFGGVSAGIAQGMYTGEDFTAESTDDERSTQGGNVIVGDVAIASLQAAVVDGDVELTMEDGTRNTQGLNVIRGEAAALALQVGLVDGDIDLESKDNSRAAQGVNVVNACEGCN